MVSVVLIFFSVLCFVFVCVRHVSCVPNVASFSGLFILYWSSVFPSIYQKNISKFNKTLDKKQLIKTVQYHRTTTGHIQLIIGVGSSIKSGGVYLVWCAQTSPFSEMVQSCTCFPHVSKIQTLNRAISVIIKNTIILNITSLHSISNLRHTEWQLRSHKIW